MLEDSYEHLRNSASKVKDKMRFKDSRMRGKWRGNPVLLKYFLSFGDAVQRKGHEERCVGIEGDLEKT